MASLFFFFCPTIYPSDQSGVAFFLAPSFKEVFNNLGSWGLRNTKVLVAFTFNINKYNVIPELLRWALQFLCSVFWVVNTTTPNYPVAVGSPEKKTDYKLCCLMCIITQRVTVWADGSTEEDTTEQHIYINTVTRSGKGLIMTNFSILSYCFQILPLKSF